MSIGTSPRPRRPCPQTALSSMNKAPSSTSCPFRLFVDSGISYFSERPIPFLCFSSFSAYPEVDCTLPPPVLVQANFTVRNDPRQVLLIETERVENAGRMSRQFNSVTSARAFYFCSNSSSFFSLRVLSINESVL